MIYYLKIYIVYYKRMSEKIEINTKIYNHSEYNGKNLEKLELLFSGKDINIKLINSLRRACINGVPGYGFARELIKIKENTTIGYNNDYMSLRLSHLPIFNVKNKKLNLDPNISYLHEKYWNNINFNDSDRLKVLDDKKQEIEKNIEMQINVVNETNSELNVDTNNKNIKVYIENELVDMYDKKFPILIIKLKPKEKFNCYLKGVLSVGEKNNIFSNCTNSWHYYEDEEKEENIILSIRSYGLLNVFDIYIRGCEYLLKRISILRKIINTQLKKIKIDVNSFLLELINEDNTIADLLNYELQENKDILYSGISIPDNLKKNINIKINCNENLNQEKFIKIISNCFDNLEKKINKIHKNIIKLKK